MGRDWKFLDGSEQYDFTSLSTYGKDSPEMSHIRHLFSFLKPLCVTPSHKHAVPTLQKPRSDQTTDLSHVQTECQKPMYKMFGCCTWQAL